MRIRTDAVINNIQQQSTYLEDTGVADAYAVAFTNPILTYSAGLQVTFRAIFGNTGPSTLDVNGMGPKDIRKNVSTSLTLGDILATQIVTVIYDGTYFQLVGGSAGVSGYTGYSGYSAASPGPSGYSGYMGESGYSGYIGNSGYSGYGSIGADGASGYSGYSGYIGNSGYSGYTGYSGYSGYSAYSGISGFSGYSGKSGYSGYSGYTGYSGYSGGGAGSSGFSGYSAYSGISGYSGYSGKSGYSGYSGATAGPTILLSAAGGWVPITNGATIPAQEELATNKQNFLFIDFPDGASTKYAEWTVIVPCSVSVTNIRASFIWTANSTSGNSVVWQIQASATKVGDALDRSWSTPVTSVTANSGVAYKHNEYDTTTFTPAGYSEGYNTIMQVRVFRDPTDGSDTLADTARLIGVILYVTPTTCL